MLSHCQGGSFAMSIALVTMAAFLPMSLASLLFTVITLSVTLMKQ